MKTIVVTGAGGFIGQQLCRELIAQGRRVLAVSRRSARPITNAELATVADYQDTPCPADSVCVHLAANNHIGAVQNDPTRALEDSLGIAKALLRKSFRKIVYVSSSAVYGDRDGSPHTEAGATNPLNKYAEIKLATEKLFRDTAHVVARPANVYGPGMSLENVISDILKQMPGDAPIQVRNAASTRDYLHVSDAVRGLAVLATTDQGPGTFNLGSGRASSVAEIIAILLQINGQRDRQVESLSNAPSTLIVDSTRIAESYGWRASKSLEEGLKKLLKVTR